MAQTEKIKNSGYFYQAIIALVMFFAGAGACLANASPDAIAVRVMPNSSHYSPSYWYKNNIKVQGAPQALIVDGYEAVRDGRTVYVNGANLANGGLYTNIYIISYNQDADASTIDIFGQMLAHWKFNTNLTQAGVCSQSANLGCLNYNDCPGVQYCSSKKAQVVRDVKRLSDLSQIKLALTGHAQRSGSFPLLPAGSYLARKSVSVWPSWQETLAKALGATLPVDPVNKLGNCPGGYDKITCWDPQNKKYSQVVGENQMPLPANSLAYTYSANNDGTDFNLCAQTESGYLPASYCLTK